MIDTLLFPFQFPFMQNAFWVVLLVVSPAALLSCFLVLKGWALMGMQSAMRCCPALYWHGSPESR